MLVLSRKKGQKIVIGGDIELTVVEVSGDRIKLGINAPREVPVYREEVQRRIMAELAAAAEPAEPAVAVV